MQDAEAVERISAVPVDAGPRLLSESEFRLRAFETVGGRAEAEVNNALFVVVRDDGSRLFPSFLLDRVLKRRQLVALVKRLEGVDDLAKWLFFVSPKASLCGLTPLEALRQGKYRQVKVAAEGFAQR